MTIEKVLVYILFCIVAEILLAIGAKWARKKRKINHFHAISALLHKIVCFGISIIIIFYLFKQSILIGFLGILLTLTSPHSYIVLGIIIGLPSALHTAYKLWKATAYLRSVKKFCEEQEKNPSKPEPYYSKSQKEWVKRELEALKKRQEEGVQ